MKKASSIIIVSSVLFSMIIYGYGCGAGSTSTDSTTATTSTTISADSSTTTTSSPTTTTSSEFIILSQSPTLEATEVLSTETLSITFSRAISLEGLTINNFFTDIATFGSFHNVGEPDISTASLTWDASSNTLYLSGIAGWASYEAGTASMKVYVVPQYNMIRDLSGNSLGTTNDLWLYTLQYVQNPYDGVPIDGAVFTNFVTDEVGDATTSVMPGETPFYFDENDITRVSAALVGDRIVVSVEVVGIMDNTLEVTTVGSEEIDYRDISIGLDLDNNDATGYSSWGMDIQITLYRGLGVYPDCQYGVYEFNEADTHVIDRFPGQMHHGGQGYRYATFSAPVSAVDFLGVTIEAGMSYKLMGWSESETQNGTLDFACDTISQGGTTKVPTILGGE
ncbi:MAG: hypothetical protein ABIE84_03370 [bacterium]